MVQNERARARLCIPTHVVLFASASFSHTVILRSHASSTYSYTRSVECDMYAETMIPNAAEHTIVLRSNGNAYQYDEFVCGNATQRTLAHQRYRCWFGFTSALLWIERMCAVCWPCIIGGGRGRPHGISFSTSLSISLYLSYTLQQTHLATHWTELKWMSDDQLRSDVK